jgi:hypothetical protein
MADKKTLIPIAQDKFLGQLDYLNTGSLTTQYVPGTVDMDFTSLDERIEDALVDLDFTVDEIGNAGFRNLYGGHPKNANGQYAAIPGATPKYARHLPGRNRENYDTLARMYIRVPKDGRADAIRKNLQNSVSRDVASVMMGDGSAKSSALGYVDFFLDSIQSNLSEKVQVTEVLEDNFVAFFFGASPPTQVFTGHLMNTLQDDWAVQMLAAYQDLFRGTMLARRGLQLYIRYDSYIVSGACTGLSLTRSSQNENIVPFSLQMLVHRQHLLYGNAFGSTQLPASAGSFIPTDAFPFSEPKVAQLRPLIAKAAKVPTDGINGQKPDGPQSNQAEDEMDLVVAGSEPGGFSGDQTDYDALEAARATQVEVPVTMPPQAYRR